MVKQVQINLTPAAAADDAAIKKIAASLAGINLIMRFHLSELLNGLLMQGKKISV